MKLVIQRVTRASVTVDGMLELNQGCQLGQPQKLLFLDLRIGGYFQKFGGLGYVPFTYGIMIHDGILMVELTMG